MIRRLVAVAIALACVVAASPAFAKPKNIQVTEFCGDRYCSSQAVAREVEKTRYRRGGYDGAVIGGRPAGCPVRYCGCGVSLRVFGRIIPELNLAYNWLRKFAPAHPAPGMVAARSGHVFYIESINGDGSVIAYDPNSGNGLTRRHTVSLRGYRVVDPTTIRVALR